MFQVPRLASLLLSYFYMQQLPDPRFHWAIHCGDYYHELNSNGLTGDIVDWHMINCYQNGKIGDGVKWSNKTKIGETTFNDNAIREAGPSYFFPPFTCI